MGKWEINIVKKLFKNICSSILYYGNQTSQKSYLSSQS